VSWYKASVSFGIYARKSGVQNADEIVTKSLSVFHPFPYLTCKLFLSMLMFVCLSLLSIPVSLISLLVSCLFIISLYFKPFLFCSLCGYITLFMLLVFFYVSKSQLFHASPHGWDSFSCLLSSLLHLSFILSISTTLVVCVFNLFYFWLCRIHFFIFIHFFPFSLVPSLGWICKTRWWRDKKKWRGKQENFPPLLNHSTFCHLSLSESYTREPSHISSLSHTTNSRTRTRTHSHTHTRTRTHTHTHTHAHTHTLGCRCRSFFSLLTTLWNHSRN
jgi:hypothetical protein